MMRTPSPLAILRLVTVAGLAIALLFAPAPVSAQETIQTDANGLITIPRGGTAVISRPDSIRRVSISDPEIAEALPFPPNQIVINAKQVGSTSLVLWGASSIPRIFTIEVTADVASLRRQIEELFPDADIRITTTGQTVVMSGTVRDPSVVRKAFELAETMGIPLVNNIDAPAPEQILLHVEFAEVARSAIRELGGDLVRVLNPETLDHAFDRGDRHEIETLSSGFVTLMVEGGGSRLDAVIRLLKNRGEFKSLAEPNLVTVEGQEATFLAGGEFPFPTIQAGSQAGGISITWKEFGIRLRFTPTITNSGNIRLAVEPEVSSLDFANGLTIAGFQIPSILARRVQSDVELRHGQTLAIGGLLDNSILEDVDKIPLLGDLPILGFLFKSEAIRQNRTELLVLVTPYILDPDNLPAPALPTGDPLDWNWDQHLRELIEARPDTTTMGGAARSGGSGNDR